MNIEKNWTQKLVIEKDQLWIIEKRFGALHKSPIGKYAILTNKGISPDLILYDY